MPVVDRTEATASRNIDVGGYGSRIALACPGRRGWAHFPIQFSDRHSGMVREHQTSDAQLRIGESRDSGFEASHRPGMTRSGLLRRFRLRSLSYGGQVAPRNDVKNFMTPRSRGARGPSFAKPFAQKSEGAGNAGWPMHPQSRVRNETKHTSVVTTGSDGSLRHSPRNGFTAYFALSPVTRLV